MVLAYLRGDKGHVVFERLTRAKLAQLAAKRVHPIFGRGLGPYTQVFYHLTTNSQCNFFRTLTRKAFASQEFSSVDC